MSAPPPSAPAPRDTAAALLGRVGDRPLRFLRRVWWLPVTAAALAVGGQAAYLLTRPDEYVASARMWVGGSLRLPEKTGYSEEWQNFFGTQIELMKSQRILRRAHERVMSLGTATNGAPSRVDVSQPRKTAIFQLDTRGPEAGYLEVYLNAVMDEYLAYRREVRAASSDDTVASLTDQLYKQERLLEAAQRRLTAFQRTNNAVVLQEEGVSAGNYLARLNVQLADLRLEHELVNAMSNSPAAGLNAGLSGWSLDSRRLSELGLPDAAVAGAGSAPQQLTLLRLYRDDLGRHLRPKHPEMVRLTEEIERGEKLLAGLREQTAEQVAAAQEALWLKIQSVDAAARAWEAKVLDLNARVAEVDRLKMDVQRAHAVQAQLLDLVQSVDVTKQIDQESVSVLDRAVVGPAGKRLPLKLGLAGAVGLFLGLGLVLGVERLDDRLASIADLRARFRETVIGQVPDVRGRRRAPLRPIDPADDRHAFLESYRALRSALLFMLPAGNRARTLLITSPVPGEGKTTAAANLGRILAFAGSRVLLVDADLRRGVLHAAFGVPAQPGLTDLLRGGAPLAAVRRETGLPGLDLIPAGNAAAEAGELVLSERFDGLLREVAAAYDYVLIDSGPVFATADTTSLAPKLDGVIVVVREGFTRMKWVDQALERFYQRRAHVLGFVYNRAHGAGREYRFYQPPGAAPPAAASA